MAFVVVVRSLFCTWKTLALYVLINTYICMAITLAEQLYEHENEHEHGFKLDCICFKAWKFTFFSKAIQKRLFYPEKLFGWSQMHITHCVTNHIYQSHIYSIFYKQYWCDDDFISLCEYYIWKQIQSGFQTKEWIFNGLSKSQMLMTLIEMNNFTGGNFLFCKVGGQKFTSSKNTNKSELMHVLCWKKQCCWNMSFLLRLKSHSQKIKDQRGKVFKD